MLCTTEPNVDASMYQEKSPVHRELERLEQVEEETWIEFYPQARRDASLAAEILTELDRDDALRRRLRGLYLCCQRCIRLHESREARHQRIGQAFRHLFKALFIVLPLGAMDLVRRSSHLAVACLPETAGEPTDRRLRRLMERDAYAQAGPSFKERARKAADRSDTTSAPSAATEASIVARHEAIG